MSAPAHNKIDPDPERRLIRTLRKEAASDKRAAMKGHAAPTRVIPFSQDWKSWAGEERTARLRGRRNKSEETKSEDKRVPSPSSPAKAGNLLPGSPGLQPWEN